MKKGIIFDLDGIFERNRLDKAIYVGDTQGDLDGAMHADIPFVYATYGFGNLLEQKYVISKFSDITECASMLL